MATVASQSLKPHAPKIEISKIIALNTLQERGDAQGNHYAHGGQQQRPDINQILFVELFQRDAVPQGGHVLSLLRVRGRRVAWRQLGYRGNVTGHGGEVESRRVRSAELAGRGYPYWADARRVLHSWF